MHDTVRPAAEGVARRSAPAGWQTPAMDGRKLLNPPQCPECFGCGPANPRGLQLEIYQDGTDAVATFSPTGDLSGYPDRLHGGVIGLLVDEMLVYAGAPHGLWGMTAKVRYWVRKPIPLDAITAPQFEQSPGDATVHVEKRQALRIGGYVAQPGAQ